MKDYGKVSIIMPSFNSGAHIAESIQSVLDQTYQNWELLIQDGNSSDDTLKIVSSFRDKRIFFQKDTENLGGTHSRNVALQRATGAWIAFLDSDDLWNPHKLEKQLDFMSANGFKFSYTTYYEIDENGNKTGTLVSGPKKIGHFLMSRYVFPGCLTCVYRFDQVGLIQVDERLWNGANDDALFLRVSERAVCHLLNEPLGMYRVSRGSASHKGIFKNLKYQYTFYRYDRKHSKFVSWYLSLRKACYYVFVKKPFFRKKTALNEDF